MRSLLVALLLVPLPALAASPPADAGPPAHCAGNDRVVPAGDADEARRGFHRLDRLPPAADEFLTVYRRVGACLAPVIVRRDIGSRR